MFFKVNNIDVHQGNYFSTRVMLRTFEGFSFNEACAGKGMSHMMLMRPRPSRKRI